MVNVQFGKSSRAHSTVGNVNPPSIARFAIRLGYSSSLRPRCTRSLYTSQF